MGVNEASPEVEELGSRISELKESKGQLSRRIGDIRNSGNEAAEHDIASLVEELKVVSTELKLLQKRMKQQLRSSTKPTSAWKPGKPQVESAILNRQECEFKVVEAFPEEVTRATADYVLQHPASTIWHLPEVSEFIQNTYGHSCRYFYVLDSESEVRGVLPVSQLKSRLFGNFMVSVPYFNYGGVLADNQKIAGALVLAAERWRDSENAQHVELRHCSDLSLGLPQRKDKQTFWLPLPENSKELWDSFQPKLRAQIRKGEREISNVEIGGLELLDDFYRVFAHNMRDLGTPVYSKAFFQNLVETLGERARIVVVRINGEAAGCAILCCFGGRMEIPWASTLRKQNHTGVNMAMYWKALEYSVSIGCRLFDFGRCSKDTGTARFKQQWGASEIPLFWDYALSRGAEFPNLNPNNPKYRLLIAAWKRLPVWMSRLIGPGIVKYLP
ncbi:GNAT family N-acetyltransferase [Marinobacter guineae]|uniref:GNAT family N-acetyltransferase n=1 Tax=Marinobacter guineae TaxID=432303 RepID=A0A2G1VHW0_9GAMM|nr:FemAB family XrtA/PEP-CTERM system-associated protein [Marinobacter guineae]PHQ26365.1 GNAT family N-acetyltransferase [Marinobacter guineae]